MIPKTKVCKTCEKRRRACSFYRHSNGGTGLQSECKSCLYQRVSRWRAANRDKYNTWARKYLHEYRRGLRRKGVAA